MVARAAKGLVFFGVRSPNSRPLLTHAPYRQADYYREPLQKPVQPRVLLEAEGLSFGKAYRNVSFKLHAGEILGIAGVIGSGREELTRTLAGFAPHDGGRLTIADREVTLTTPAEAVDLGVGYLPRERRVEGLVLFLPVAANITLADLASLTHYGIVDAREERRRAMAWVDRLKIRTTGIQTLCLNLSGGNLRGRRMHSRQAPPVDEGAADAAVAKTRQDGRHPRFVEGEELGVGHLARGHGELAMLAARHMSGVRHVVWLVGQNEPGERIAAPTSVRSVLSLIGGDAD